MLERTEAARLEALRQLDLLDTPPFESFDRITRVAGQLFAVPMAAISLTDHDRQWFKSRIGIGHGSLQRERAPCAQVSESCQPLVVPDLRSDPLFRDSAFARAGIRFYAGAPLVTGEGFGLGAMCVMAPEPRSVSPVEMASLRDLAAMVMGQIQLQHAFGRVDAVSLMPNRAQFVQDMEDLARTTFGSRPRIAVLVDLATPEQLSNVVRVRGPAYLDEIVQQSARAIRAAIGPRRKAYHIAATQFAYLAPEGVGLQAYAALVGKNLALLRLGMASRFVTTTAVGVAPFVLGELDPRDVLRTAHSAAQEGRRAESKVGVYSPAHDTAHHRRFAIIDGFGAALERSDQLRLVYQPRIDLASGACTGAEALLRWRHPTLGEVSPGEFMPLVEQTEMARATTAWVLDTALKQLAAWRASGLELQVSVNMSATNLLEGDVAERVGLRLTQHRLPGDCLELELTESAVMEDAGQALERLEAIAALGVRLAIDDFGTGYSSLSYLQRLPAHVVKIDQSFLLDVATDDRKRALVTTMIALSHDLGYRVVAEGVETRGALDVIESAGCDEAQGYLFARPMAPEHFTSWLKDWVSHRISPIEPRLPGRALARSVVPEPAIAAVPASQTLSSVGGP